jgi:hypothetical protein
MIGDKRRKYMQILNNNDHSFGDSIFDLGSVENMSNIESLDQILYSSFEIGRIGQTTTNANSKLLAPIAESETEFQDTANSEQVQREDLVMSEVTSMTDKIDLNKMQE